MQKAKIFRSLFFILTVAWMPVCAYAQGADWYFGFFGNKMFSGKDYELSFDSDAADMKFFAIMDDGTYQNNFIPSGNIQDSLFAKDSMSFEKGEAFGGFIGTMFANGFFLEGELGMRNKLDGVESKLPIYIDGRNQFVTSEVKSGFINAGFVFNTHSYISPFFSAGIGLAKINQYGEYRLSVGDRTNMPAVDDIDLLDYQTYSENRGHFEVESDLLLGGNIKAGLSANFGNASILLSYRFTAIEDSKESTLEDFKSYARNPKWSVPYNASIAGDSFGGAAQGTLYGGDTEPSLVAKIFANDFFDHTVGKSINGLSYSDHAIEVSVVVPFGRQI